jgi:formate-dependent nitrite reductase membrane component NrfD
MKKFKWAIYAFLILITGCLLGLIMLVSFDNRNPLYNAEDKDMVIGLSVFGFICMVILMIIIGFDLLKPDSHGKPDHT